MMHKNLKEELSVIVAMVNVVTAHVYIRLHVNISFREREKREREEVKRDQMRTRLRHSYVKVWAPLVEHIIYREHTSAHFNTQLLFIC